MKNKKAISPLIATVLVIGFTIVLAALVIQWGGTLFTGMKERTAVEAEVSQACSTGLANLELEDAVYNATAQTVTVTVDNRNEITVAGFLFRIYKDDTVNADTTHEETSIGAYVINDYVISGITEIPDKIGAFPRVRAADNSIHTCTNELTINVI